MNLYAWMSSERTSARIHIPKRTGGNDSEEDLPFIFIF
jgi:hypothetical protein